MHLAHMKVLSKLLNDNDNEAFKNGKYFSANMLDGMKRHIMTPNAINNYMGVGSCHSSQDDPPNYCTIKGKGLHHPLFFQIFCRPKLTTPPWASVTPREKENSRKKDFISFSP